MDHRAGRRCGLTRKRTRVAARELLAESAGAIAIRSRRDLTTREIRGDATLIRRARDADADLLVAWHDDPEVARYWDEERFTRDEMLGRLARSDVDPYIVEAGGVPVDTCRSGTQAPLPGSTCSSSPRHAAAASARTPRVQSRDTCARSEGRHG